MWLARSGDFGILARCLPRIDSAWICWRRGGHVAGAKDGPSGAVCRADRHDQLPDRLVNHRLRAVRGDYCATNKTELLATKRHKMRKCIVLDQLSQLS